MWSPDNCKGSVSGKRAAAQFALGSHNLSFLVHSAFLAILGLSCVRVCPPSCMLEENCIQMRLWYFSAPMNGFSLAVEYESVVGILESGGSNAAHLILLLVMPLLSIKDKCVFLSGLISINSHSCCLLEY